MASGTDTFVSKDSRLYQDYDHLYKSLFLTESIVVLVEGDDVRSAQLMQAVDRLEHQLPGFEFVTGVAFVILVPFFIIFRQKKKA